MTRHYRRPAHVAVVDGHDLGSGDGTVYLGDLCADQLIRLTDSAATIWRSLEDQPCDGLIERVAQAAGVRADDVAADVTAFVADLTDRGLIAEVERDEGVRP